MSQTTQILVLAALVLPSLASCAAPDEGGVDCADGHCDTPDSDVPASPCDGIIKDRSGANHKRVAGRNGDALAKLALQKGTKCPTSFPDMMATLRQNDKTNCAGERDGIATRFISETAQALQQAGSYRTVTTRTCNNRDTSSIIFSQFANAGGSPPKTAEIISFDETAGVFNFYDTDGSSMNFFGSSKDLLKGPDGQTRRCAGCHVGGGLIMKELDTPWMHWEGHVSTPGTQELVDANKDFGSKSTGAEFEGVVKNANTKWNKIRLQTLRDNKASLQEILKPLFCTVEINIDNGSDFASPITGGPGGDELTRIPFDSLLDPTLKSFGSIPVVFNDYDGLIKANGQTLGNIPGAIDTAMHYAFVERSFIDNDYVQALKAAGIVDDDFIKDVLMVDFTRPVFSDDRCGLLTFAPKLTGADLTAAKLRDGFISSLESETPAAGSPGAQLLKHLKNTADNHDATLDAFIAACTALGSKPFLTNALAVTSLNRETARSSLNVIEFPETFPTDRQNVSPGTRLNPTTCELVNGFVAP